MPLGQRFDAQKAIEAILYVAHRVRDPSFHRISKVLYFADKQHLTNYGCLITGDDYVAMKHGPVPSGVYDLLKSVRGDGSHHDRQRAAEAFAIAGTCRIQPHRSENRELLSDADVESMDAAIHEFGDLPFEALTRRSHDAAWRAADDNEFISLEDIARASSGGKDLVRYIRD